MQWVALFALVAVAAAAPLRVQWGEAPLLTMGWHFADYADDSLPMDIVIALEHSGADKLEETANAVSDPKSPRYGQHLTPAEIAELVAPSGQTLAEVNSWLAGVEHRFGPTGDMIFVETTVGVVERLFNTRVHHVRNKNTNQKTFRCEDTSIPSNLAGHVASVFGLYDLPLPPQGPIVGAAPGAPADVTPSVIEQVYNISGVTISGSTKNLQAVAEFQGQYMTKSDLTTFFKQYVPKAPATDAVVYKFVGPNSNKPGFSIEAALDIQYIMGVDPGLKTEFWLYPAQSFCADLVKWTEAILQQSNPPNVFSVSYGWQGNLTQVGCDQSEVMTVDKEFQKLATAGISIIFASGDSGSGYNPGCFTESNTKYVGEVIKKIEDAELFECCGNCTGECGSWNFDEETRECELVKKSMAHYAGGWSSGPPADGKLFPSWPASSPWVTSVGSTRFINQKPGDGEQATDQFGSGSGFSHRFTAPSYQTEAISGYFKEEPSSKLPPQALWPRNGRATPDVAALGEGFQVVVDGHVTTVGGTSAATPTFSATISQCNDARIKAGKKALGFLNHWIYQEGNKIFRDVTVGSDRFGRGPFPLAYGFDCQKGWDPVTGFGSPDFPKMLESCMAAP